MTHAQIDDRFDDHPSYANYGAAEMGVIACAITYCNRNLTDGVIPAIWPRRRFGRQGVEIAKQLVTDGVWERRSADGLVTWPRRGDDVTVTPRERADDAFVVVGFLDHNPSKAEVVRRRDAAVAAKAAAGRIGGQRSGEVRKAKAEAESKQAASSERKQSAEANEALSSPLRSSPLERESTRAKQPSETTENAPSAIRLRAAPATAEAVFPMPGDLPLTAEARAAADTLGVRDIDDEWVKFRAHQIRTGATSTARGWYQGGWGKWIVDAARYQRRERERDAARGKADPSTPPAKGAEEHPLARTPRKREMTPQEFAEGGRRFLAALQGHESASAEDEEARRAV